MKSPAQPLVIVVEDHDDSREVLEECLRFQGFRVQGLRSAEEAIVSILATLPAAVISDLTLPGMSGEELALRVRKEPSLATIAIIALSGRELDSLSARVFDAVLLKPADVLTLGDSVHRAIERARTKPRVIAVPADASAHDEPAALTQRAASAESTPFPEP
jgi:two-component system, response regulator, stage 0 sporulation protein F